MSPSRIFECAVIAIDIAMLPTLANAAELRLANVWSDRAVIQRDALIRVFGFSRPRSDVRAEFAGTAVDAKADDVGRFVVELPAQGASAEPRSLRVSSGSEAIEVKDLLVGEVWLCSGQSNMEWHVEWCDGAAEAANSPDPALRMYTGEVTFGFEPFADAPGRWEATTASTVAHFSATAYWFGRELRRELDVPIGLVHVSWGGSAIEAWTSLEALRGLPSAARYLEAYEKYRVELAAGSAAQAEGESGVPDPRHRPAHLFHGMIHPLLDLSFRGAIWYQGESNATADRGDEYREFLPAMIRDWRARFRNGEFPFLIVQLPNFAPGDDYWRYPVVRDSQLDTARSMKNVGLAVTVDLGDDVDIHPKNKPDVGRRLSRLALHHTYGRKEVVPTGPLFRAASFADAKARVEFDLFGSSLVGTETGEGETRTLAGFEIAGESQVFVPAKARVVGDGVFVWSEQVTDPKFVRYGWHGSPPISLRNAEGIPASPFDSR